MGREILKAPEWSYWPRDWASEIKSRTGWTDAQLAERLGVCERTVNLMKKEPCNRSGKLILRLLWLREQVKGGTINDKIGA